MSLRSRFSFLWFAVAALFFASYIFLTVWQYRFRTAVVSLASEKLYVQVASTPKQTHRGLGGKDSLGEFDGMLFVFANTGRIGIVMRQMRFPIDVVWIGNGAIVDIAPNVEPELGVADEDLRVYRPRADASFVVELSAGAAERLGFKIGDRFGVVDE